MGNPLLSIFLCNVHWKIIKQSENSDFHRYHDFTSATAILSDILKMLPGIIWNIE